MKRLAPLSSAAALLFGLLPTAHGAQPYEISTLLGTANEDLPFVQSIVKNRVAIAPGANFTDLTTGVMYFLERNGARSVQSIQVVREGGNALLNDVLGAIDIAARDSALVLAPLAGEEQERMCEKMAEKTDTAFLVSLGELGYTLSPLYTKCAARNILFVTVLNKELTGLAEFASYGPLVRLAVPGWDLEAPVDREGRKAAYRSDIFGMAAAVGKIAELNRRNPELKGAALISQFLAEQEVLPALRGKIPGSRALRKFEK